MFALACIEPSNYGRAISHWTEENWRMRWSSSASWRVSPHVMWDDYFKRRNSNHTRSVTGWLPGRRIWRQSQWHYPALHECNWASKARRTHRVYRWNDGHPSPRTSPDLPLRPGKVQRREFEYIRHGTQSLIANFDVATGQVICPTCGDTRTEVDFAAHVRVLIESEPDAKNGIWLPIASIRINPNL